MVLSAHLKSQVDELLSDDEANALYAYFGRAVYASNILEHGLVNALFSIELLPKVRSFPSSEEWLTAVENFFSSCFKKTFGELIHRLESTGKLKNDTAELIGHAKTARNFLVHRFSRENARLFYTEKGRAELKQQCINATKLFDVADTALESEFSPLRAEYGVDEKWLEDRYQEGIEQLLKEQS